MTKKRGFFHVHDWLRRLSDLGDQPKVCGRTVDVEPSRADLNAALAFTDGAKGGRRPLIL